MKVTEYYKWAILFFVISILDSSITLIVIELGFAKEASPLAAFLLDISNGYFFSTRTGLVALAIIPLEAGYAKRLISNKRRDTYYIVAVTSYIVFYIVGILKVNT